VPRLRMAHKHLNACYNTWQMFPHQLVQHPSSLHRIVLRNRQLSFAPQVVVSRTGKRGEEMSRLGGRGKEEAQASFPRIRPFFWEGLETLFLSAERKGFPSGDCQEHNTVRWTQASTLQRITTTRWFLTEGHIPHNAPVYF
jgi:hypothetical protein